jgi:hypothetical protein
MVRAPSPACEPLRGGHSKPWHHLPSRPNANAPSVRRPRGGDTHRTGLVLSLVVRAALGSWNPSRTHAEAHRRLLRRALRGLTSCWNLAAGRAEYGYPEQSRSKEADMYIGGGIILLIIIIIVVVLLMRR